MINIVYSFLGCFFALLINELIKKKSKNAMQTKTNRRETAINVKSFADPLVNYKRYKDEDNLYKTYVPKKSERRKQ